MENEGTSSDVRWQALLADVRELDDPRLTALWAATMAELRVRGLVRSANEPVADYAERVAAAELGLTLMARSTKGYDAVGAYGLRYQIKRRRRTVSQRCSSALSETCLSAHFDVLLALVFHSDLEHREMWSIPHAAAATHARFHQHVNGHVMRLNAAVYCRSRVSSVCDNYLREGRLPAGERGYSYVESDSQDARRTRRPDGGWFSRASDRRRDGQRHLDRLQ